MKCPNCSLNTLAEFPAEVMIHCVGGENINFPGVLIFPKLLVCLECGSTQFVIQQAELPQLIRCSRKSSPPAV
jgi:hypothetical protein